MMKAACILPRSLVVLALAGAALASAPGARAALFEDDEARRAILELRQRFEAQRIAAERQVGQSDEQRKLAEDSNAQLRRSLLDLQNQIEALRSELARMGQVVKSASVKMD